MSWSLWKMEVFSKQVSPLSFISFLHLHRWLWNLDGCGFQLVWKAKNDNGKNVPKSCSQTEVAIKNHGLKLSFVKVALCNTVSLWMYETTTDLWQVNIKCLQMPEHYLADIENYSLQFYRCLSWGLCHIGVTTFPLLQINTSELPPE